jgi:hypothetical protein
MPAARTLLPALLLCGLLAACGKSPSAEIGGAKSGAESAATPATVAMTAAGGPKRRDGYWEMGSFSDTGTPMSKQFLCVGGASEDKFSVFDQLAMVGDCSEKTFTRTATGWTFQTSCKLMDKVTVQKGTISGDFQDNFRVDQTVTQAPQPPIKGSVRGKRVGDCPAKFKPGDLVDGSGNLVGNMLAN